MHGHDFYSLYSTKAVEYILAVSYLLLFIPFWRYVNGGKQKAVALARAAADAVQAPVRLTPATALTPATTPGWFEVPTGVHLHPGHAWARVVGDEVRIGMDEFAQKLVGAMDSLRLPQVGDTLRQGEPAFAVTADGKTLDLLAPLAGEVTAVNRAALERPALVADGPYEQGWLVALKAPRLVADLKQLISGAAARRWLDESFAELTTGHGRELGLVMQDGGAPVAGLARVLSPDGWDDLCRTHFRT